MVPAMKILAEPLFLNTQIYNFSYLKFYQNGSLINLTTDINWIDYRFNENIKYNILFESELENIQLDKPYMYLWPNEIENKLLGALHHFGIWNGCNIFIPSAFQIEVFSFATTVENTNIQSFYANNFNLLNSYIVYFKERISTYIDDEEPENKISTDIIFPLLKSCEIMQPNEHFSSWIKDKPAKVHLDKNVCLTYKEIECYHYLSKGYSLKSIANRLGISPRTVETHINNVKLKTNCQNKDVLLKYLNNKKWIFDSLFNQ